MRWVLGGAQSGLENLQEASSKARAKTEQTAAQGNISRDPRPRAKPKSPRQPSNSCSSAQNQRPPPPQKSNRSIHLRPTAHPRPPCESVSLLLRLVLLTPHSSILSPRIWAVGPSALPCAGGFPPQRPPSTTRPAPRRTVPRPFSFSPPQFSPTVDSSISTPPPPAIQKIPKNPANPAPDSADPPASRQPSRKSPRILQILLQTAQNAPRRSPAIQEIPKNPANPASDSADPPPLASHPKKSPRIQQILLQTAQNAPAKDACPARLPALKESTSQVVADSGS